MFIAIQEDPVMGLIKANLNAAKKYSKIKSSVLNKKLTVYKY